MHLKSLVAAVGAASLLLSGCGAGGGDDGDDAQVAIVASTNVWGQIAQQIGGDAVSVTSIISDSSKDPHSYEITTADKLHMSKADLVIENGGGYDDFMKRLSDSLGDEDTPTVNAVATSGITAHDGELNEHVWYNAHAVAKVADAIAANIEKQAPDAKKQIHRNLARFKSGTTQIERTEASIKKKFGGDAVAITEPVPLYLLQASGLTNRTPDAFSEAVEEGGDVSPAVLKDTLALFSEHRVSALFYNTQSTDEAAEQVKKAARKNGVPVVGVAETLPKGKDYREWMTDNLDHVKRALRR
ncbi:metal ABC transporter solute-binding protein, Zn/Mn family [Spelaeicoccus albus]|uniref:Zinc/manganese transport system substrate-binding protein n=1 Tax=Spelaeicoccus albus TaxID=1280376 RepID=A0A7Z0A8X3_9MICO|nr:zinc ABC transporter substrate-binding protein [Spelaeicoccus albus]NYI65748.1 zinc/manganese transport system substrate-binding protein [Spelaeicoccus albus]